jgi:hypothetical protein
MRVLPAFGNSRNMSNTRPPTSTLPIFVGTKPRVTRALNQVPRCVDAVPAHRRVAAPNCWVTNCRHITVNRPSAITSASKNQAMKTMAKAKRRSMFTRYTRAARLVVSMAMALSKTP